MKKPVIYALLGAMILLSFLFTYKDNKPPKKENSVPSGIIHIKIGMTTKDVMSKIGVPDEIRNKTEFSEKWYYGDCSILIASDTVFSLDLSSIKN